MRRSNKKNICFLLFTIELFLFSAFTRSVSAKEPSPLCDADEYVLLMTEPSYMDIYNSEGIFSGTCRMNFTDSYYPAIVLNQRDVVPFSDGTNSEIFSLKTLETILSFPLDEYQLSTCMGFTLAVRSQDGSFSLYDNEGNLLYSRETPLWDSSESGAGNIFTVKNGLVFGTVCFSDMPVPSSPVWISLDGKEVRELRVPVFEEAFSNWELSGFGDYLMVHNWETNSGILYDFDGTPRMDQISSALYPHNPDFYSKTPPLFAQWIIRNNNGQMEVYDSDLTLHGILPDSENPYPGCTETYVEGISYPELENRPCAGFIRYNGCDWLPYADTPKGCVVLMENKELVHFTLGTGETLSAFNDAYRIVGYTDGNYEYRGKLIHRKTGEVLKESQWTDTKSVSFELGKDICIIQETNHTDSSLSKTTILGADGLPLYEDTSIRCFPWSKGRLLLSRGVYHGIAAPDGQWILKSLAKGIS